MSTNYKPWRSSARLQDKITSAGTNAGGIYGTNGVKNNPKVYSLKGFLPLFQSDWNVFLFLVVYVLIVLTIIGIAIWYSVSTKVDSDDPNETWNREKNKVNLGGIDLEFSNQEDIDDLSHVYLASSISLLVLSLFLWFYVYSTYRRRVLSSDNNAIFNMKLLDKIENLGVMNFWLPWSGVLVVFLAGLSYLIMYYSLPSYKTRIPNKDIIATGNGKNFPVFYSENGSDWYQSSKNSSSKGLATGNGTAYRNDTYYVTGLGISTSSNIMNSTIQDGEELVWSDYTGGASFSIGHDIACGNSGSDPYLVAVGEGKDQIIYRNTTSGNWIKPTSITSFDLRANGAAYGVVSGVDYWVVVGENSDGTSPIKYSTNLKTWNDITPLANEFFANNVDFGLTDAGMPTWVATGRGTNTFYYATNIPSSWTPISTGAFFTQGNNVKFNPIFQDSGVSVNFWVATGINEIGKSNILYSENPISGWNEARGDLPSNANDVTQYTKNTDNLDNIYGRNIRIAVGSYPNVVTSDYKDGKKWAEVLNQEEQATLYSITPRNPKYPLSD